MILRPATPADADEIAALFSASRGLLTFLPPLHTLAEDRNFIVHHVMSDCVVTIAERDGTIAGFIAETPGWIEHLYVAPDAVGSGIGPALLDAAKSRQSQIELWCFAANKRGRAFYERHGFVAVERTDGARNEEKLPDIRYRWVTAKA
jgi:putative acetyltransferase